MTPVLFVSVALAGGVGAVLRWAIEATVQGKSRSTFPWALLVINVVGSFALGVVTGMLAALSPEAQLLGMGVLGGFTTFSSVATATALMLEERAFRAAAVNTIGTFAAAVLAALAGMWLGCMG